MLLYEDFGAAVNIHCTTRRHVEDDHRVTTIHSIHVVDTIDISVIETSIISISSANAIQHPYSQVGGQLKQISIFMGL